MYPSVHVFVHADRTHPPAPAAPPVLAPPAPPLPPKPPVPAIGKQEFPDRMKPERQAKSHAWLTHVTMPYAGGGVWHGVQPFREHPLLGVGGTQTPPQFFSPVEQPFPPPVPGWPPVAPA